jgi:hypothetical protein
MISYAIASLQICPVGLVVFCEKVGADTLPLLRAQVALVQFGGFDVLRQGGQILELPLAQVADESLPINKSLVVVGPTASALARPLRIRILPPSVRANGSAEQSRVRGNRRKPPTSSAAPLKTSTGASLRGAFLLLANPSTTCVVSDVGRPWAE